MAKIVETKEELEEAMRLGTKEIIVKGQFADDLKKSKKIAVMSGVALGVLTAAIAAATVTAPITGGILYLAAAPVAALTGLEIATIILAVSIGIALIIAVFKDYEEISYSNGTLVLRRKKENREGEEERN